MSDEELRSIALIENERQRSVLYKTEYEAQQLMHSAVFVKVESLLYKALRENPEISLGEMICIVRNEDFVKDEG